MSAMEPKASPMCERLIDYVYGELGEAERHEYEEHLSSCASCQRERELVGKVRSALKTALPMVDPPGMGAMHAQLMHAAASRRPGRGKVIPFHRRVLAHPGLAAAASLVVVGGVVGTLLVRKQLLIPTRAPERAPAALNEQTAEPRGGAPVPAEAPAPARAIDRRSSLYGIRHEAARGLVAGSDELGSTAASGAAEGLGEASGRAAVEKKEAFAGGGIGASTRSVPKSASKNRGLYVDSVDAFDGLGDSNGDRGNAAGQPRSVPPMAPGDAPRRMAGEKAPLAAENELRPEEQAKAKKDAQPRLDEDASSKLAQGILAKGGRAEPGPAASAERDDRSTESERELAAPQQEPVTKRMRAAAPAQSSARAAAAPAPAGAPTRQAAPATSEDAALAGPPAADGEQAQKARAAAAQGRCAEAIRLYAALTSRSGAEGLSTDDRLAFARCLRTTNNLAAADQQLRSIKITNRAQATQLSAERKALASQQSAARQAAPASPPAKRSKQDDAASSPSAW